MRFPVDMPKRERRILAALGTLVLAAAAATSGLFAALLIAGERQVDAQPVREYTLEIVATDIDYGDGNVWHAWTYKLEGEEQGSVPGPTLTVTVGEKLRVRVINRLDIVHSFHTHLTNYDLEFDGSQANVIAGVGAGAMIPPGGEYTFEFEPTDPGIYYYHCHSADGDRHIVEHILQGLYGAIIVKAPDELNIRDEVIFMSETGFDLEGPNPPRYIMNGMGLPGGEHALEEIFHEQGFDGVAEQLNKTVPAISARTGETMRVHVINIGDQMHSFHAHHVQHISEGALQGRAWPANVVPLIPGTADTLRFTFTKPGLWLFHCHVVSHADAGMIGVFVIEDEEEPAEE